MKEPTAEQRRELLRTLEARFEENPHRHEGLSWADVRSRLEDRSEALRVLYRMETTGGEPDVIGRDADTGDILYCDCSPESPSGRRSLCYDRQALESRKKHPPKGSAAQMAASMGVELLDEERYFALQSLDAFDTKTSSWLHTPAEIRERGGAIFGDRRFGRVFVYHNGAESYYGARGFRGLLRV